MKAFASLQQPSLPFRTLAPLSLTHATTRCKFSRSRAYPDGTTYTSNLGALSRTVNSEAPSIELDPYARQRVSPESFANRGFAIDGGTAFVNVALLLLLFALAFERILGLDKVVNEALRKWKESRVEQRRYQTFDARQQLEKQWSGDESDSSSDDKGGEPPGTKRKL